MNKYHVEIVRWSGQASVNLFTYVIKISCIIVEKNCLKKSNESPLMQNFLKIF